MIFLLFILVFLVIADHFMKYQPQGLVFYKNAHHFSIVVAVRRYSENLEDIIEKSKRSKHEFIFVSINQAMGHMDDEALKIVEIECELDQDAYIKATPYLSRAYNEGYKHASHEFLLFMDSMFVFENLKTIDHMANNLVEHQVYTIKETLPFRDPKKGYRFFFDIFRDMNLESDMVNYAFYAVKRNTYELTGVHEMNFYQTEDFEDTIAKRNVSVVHIKQDQTIYRYEPSMTHNEYLSYWFDRMKVKSRLVGLRRLLLFLLAFHTFYGYVIFDSFNSGFGVWNIVFIILAPFVLYGAIRPYVTHHALNYALMPFYMLYFDALLLAGFLKRTLHRYKKNKTIKASEMIDDDDETPDDIAEQPNENIPSNHQTTSAESEESPIEKTTK